MGTQLYFLMAFFAAALWTFRFFWLYVPFAMGYPVLPFLKKIESYATSFYILGVWLLVMVPMALVTVTAANILQILLPGASENAPSDLYMYLFSGIQTFIETLVAIIASVGVAYGFSDIISGDNKKYKLF